MVEGCPGSASSSSCIEWTGTLNRSGYADLYLTSPNGRKMHTYAHRGVYMLQHKVLEIPRVNENGAKLEISHLCNTKICLNPTHLILETSNINRERKMCHKSGVCIGHMPLCIFMVCNLIFRKLDLIIYSIQIIETTNLMYYSSQHPYRDFE